MNDEPYDDSKPFPPEWEGENSTPDKDMSFNPLVPFLYSMLSTEAVDNLNKANRQHMQILLEKSAEICTFAGMATCDIICNKTDKNPKEIYPSFRGGFHGIMRINLSPTHLENAGVTALEMNEIWDIYTNGIREFFSSIVAQNQEKEKGDI